MISRGISVARACFCSSTSPSRFLSQYCIFLVFLLQPLACPSELVDSKSGSAAPALRIVREGSGCIVTDRATILSFKETELAGTGQGGTCYHFWNWYICSMNTSSQHNKKMFDECMSINQHQMPSFLVPENALEILRAINSSWPIWLSMVYEFLYFGLHHGRTHRGEIRYRH